MRRWPWLVAALVAGLVAAWFVARVPDIPVADLRAKYSSPPSQFVEVLPGLTVHLRDEGPRNAPVLVLLHGSNASLLDWQDWTDRLKGRYRVVRFDFPGHGLTGPDPVRGYSTAAYLAVVDSVAKARGLTRFAIAGNSMGGGVAWRYAAAHPDKVTALILVDAAGAPYPGGSDRPLGFRIARLPVIRTIVGGVLPRSLIARSLHQTVTVQSFVTPDIVDRYWAFLRYPGDRQATLERFSLAYPTPDRALLERLRMPVLILWGRDDRLIPVASVDWFQRGMPWAKTIVYDGVGHLPMEEAPDRSAADVAAFLAGAPVTATVPSLSRPDSAPLPSSPGRSG